MLYYDDWLLAKSWYKIDNEFEKKEIYYAKHDCQSSNKTMVVRI